MNRKMVLLITLGFFFTTGLESQTPAVTSGGVPLYRVTVVERTLKAVDYQYRGGPTQIDFRGTVLLPEAKGDATVESKAGRTEIDAKFQRLVTPARFGREYLTYVLWAITPEGHPKNLGEVIAGSSDKAHLRVTTDLQAFGLVVTAEPYAAVRQPSDVVVMENYIRPDTIGGVEPVVAKYELLPRGSYTYNIPADMKAIEGTGPKVSQDRYETMLEVYEAQNAVQIARSIGADQQAADTYEKAESQLRNAQDLQARGMDKNSVITAARQAAQTAADARAITLKRRQDADLAQARSQVQQEQQLRMQAEANAQRAQAQASADRITIENERAAREKAEARSQAAAAAAASEPKTPSLIVVPPPPPEPAHADDQAKREMRASLLRDLNTAMPARDTPHGLVIEIPDSDFRGAALNETVAGRLARVSAMLLAHPGLVAEVNGHSDTAGGEAERVAQERAAAVRDSLVRSGAPGNTVTARGLGNSQLFGPNFTAREREQNRRVEIVISGDPIGNMANWDRSYSIDTPRQ